MPAASSEVNTRTRTSAAIGSDTVSARIRSSSDCFAESRVSGAYPPSRSWMSLPGCWMRDSKRESSGTDSSSVTLRSITT